MGSGQTAAGVTIPDPKPARDATDLVRDSTSVLVYHHSRRVFWLGSLQGRNGLNGEFRGSGRRFEVDSADEARRVLQRYGVPEDSVRSVWTASALHTTPGIPQFLEPEVALVTAGVEYDVLGIGNVKADVLERFVPGDQRGNFVDIIENSDWTE
jgi:hypothetical protein